MNLRQETGTNRRRPNRTCDLCDSFLVETLRTTKEERNPLILHNMKGPPFSRTDLGFSVFRQMYLCAQQSPFLTALSFTPKFSGAPGERDQVDCAPPWTRGNTAASSPLAPGPGLFTALLRRKTRPGEGMLRTVSL